MTSSIRAIVALLLFITWIGAAEARQAAAPGRQRVDVARLGPQVGQRVPDFSLPDQTGRTRNLQSIMGSRGAMLVFFRSADW